MTKILLFIININELISQIKTVKLSHKKYIFYYKYKKN